MIDDLRDLSRLRMGGITAVPPFSGGRRKTSVETTGEREVEPI
jgi:hypothetical protein